MNGKRENSFGCPPSFDTVGEVWPTPIQVRDKSGPYAPGIASLAVPRYFANSISFCVKNLAPTRGTTTMPRRGKPVHSSGTPCGCQAGCNHLRLTQQSLLGASLSTSADAIIQAVTFKGEQQNLRSPVRLRRGGSGAGWGPLWPPVFIGRQCTSWLRPFISQLSVRSSLSVSVTGPFCA